MEQLLKFFNPQNYQIKLHLNKNSGSLRGENIITGFPLAKTIKFHAKNLKISSLELILDRQTKPLEFTHTEDVISCELPDSIYKLYHTIQKKSTKSCSETLAQPPLQLKFIFSTNFKHSSMEGPYLSTYQYLVGENQTKTETIIATQFESHYARQAFPCIDEPAAKATFDLTLITPGDEDTIISNTKIKSQRTLEYQTVDDNFNLGQATAKKTITTFDTTPIMSTYLLAFIVGRFHQKTVKSASGVEITSYCPLNQNPNTLDFANQTAIKSLDFYEDFFKTKYPLKKLDQVALPDFESGAMENWGLITYRESCLLASPKSSQSAKEIIATVIAHEISHQWFGNLVTMQWWDDLWLNESFATIMEYFAIDHIYPEYEIWDQFFTGECLSALRRDALYAIQAVKQPILDPAEIPTLFDPAIVYAKGARLMLMLINTIGLDNFRQGIADYFNQHAYQNTTSDDLWQSLQPYAKLDLKSFMHSWLDQPGYPVITVGKSLPALSGSVSQHRFLIDQPIPKTSSNYQLPSLSDDLSGHYLLKLSPSAFAEKLSNLKHLSHQQRFRLLIDHYLLSKASLVAPTKHLDLIKVFSHQQDDNIWSLLSLLIADLKIFLIDQPIASINGYDSFTLKHNLASFLMDQTEPLLDQIDFSPKPGESPKITKLREILLAISFDICIYASDYIPNLMADLYQKDFTKIEPSIRPFVLAAGLDRQSLFNEHLIAYQNTSDPELKSDLLYSLTHQNDQSHNRQLLALLNQPDIIRPQDHLGFFAALLKNQATREEAIDWLYQNWDYLKQLTGDKSLEDYPRILARFIFSETKADKFRDFFAPLSDDPALSRAIKLANSDLDASLKRLEAYTPALVEIFS